MTTPIYLNDEEAKLFTQFMKHRDFVKRLDELGAFALCDAKIEMLVDSYGRIGDIFIHTRHRLAGSY